MISGTAIAFLVFVVVQRLTELVIARRNTQRLLDAGAREIGAGHYPLIVAMHTAWVLALIAFGYDAQVHLGWLAIFALLQVFRVWILTSLGRRWTTRIIVLDEPLVRAGPYRWISHPNYVLVVLEVAVAPMVLGLVWVAVLFSILNAGVLFIRIRAENEGLASLRSTAH